MSDEQYGYANPKKGVNIVKYTNEELDILAEREGWTKEQTEKFRRIFVPSEWVYHNLWLPETAVPKTVPFDVRIGSPGFRQFQYDYLHDNERFIALRVSRQLGKCVYFLTKVDLYNVKTMKYVTKRIGFLFIELKIKEFFKKILKRLAK